MQWTWTAFASWYVFPRTESLDWLRRAGLTDAALPAFVSACLLNLILGVASCFFSSRRLWQCQIAVVVFYSIVIAVCMPEFLFHPFGPLTKNLAVLCCLGYLVITEDFLNRTFTLPCRS
jgi:hypothetical protein